MTDEQPGFRVTLRDVYGDVQEIKEALNEIKAAIPSQATQLSDHEKRIRALEYRVWLAVGGFGLVAALSPYLSRLIPQ